MLTITTTHQPATDIGYLLGKHPDRVQTFDIPSGKAHVFYPEATSERCSIAMLTEIDPIAITRRRSKGGNSEPVQHYVNDRPYAACSYLSSAIAEVFSSALNGNCRDRPELVDTVMPLTVKMPAVTAHHGAKLINDLFEPLGYTVNVETPPMDPAFPEWGESRHHAVTLSQDITMQQLLNHLYVLIPVLDNYKHYWVGKDEIDKLLKKGEGWLPGHPLRDLISRRYLRYSRQLVNKAQDMISQLDQVELPADEPASPEEVDVSNVDEARTITETELERPMALSEARVASIMTAIKAAQPKSVIDLGCGEGTLLAQLIKQEEFTNIAATDVSPYALDIARRKIGLHNMTNRQAERINIMQSSLIYDDPRIHNFAAAVLMEVIEHVDLSKLDAVENSVFALAKPRTVIVTTPNIEYNQLFTHVRDDGFRHRDHRFEWTREEFEQWGRNVAQQHGYDVKFEGIGNEDTTIPAGHPTQMAVFSR